MQVMFTTRRCVSTLLRLRRTGEKWSNARADRACRSVRAAVDDAAAAELEMQLNRILGYVEQLGELPKDDPSHDERSARLRKDEPSADPLRRPPSAWAPAMKSDLFTVPRLGELDPGAES